MLPTVKKLRMKTCVLYLVRKHLYILVKDADRRSVRTYVEGLNESSKLLDLLSAEQSDEIEPTRASGGRTALYSDVSCS
jgi:hypothetical protein